MLAVAGGKGGCGKTTTAIALTRVLASSKTTNPSNIEARPLLVDADTDMPDIHHYLRIDRVTPRSAHGNCQPRSGVGAVSDGVSVSKAARYPDDLAGGAVLTAGQREETALALDRCRGWPGPVIVDTPAGISPAVTVPLRIADRTLLISTDEPSCLDDVQRTASACSTLCPQSIAAIRTVREEPPALLANVPVIGTLPTVTEPLENERYVRAIEEVASHLRRSSHQ